MRSVQIAPGEFYHLYNRGAGKQLTYLEKRDYFRFLFLMLNFQFGTSIQNISRETALFVQHSVLHKKEEQPERQVELSAFCLMPNHFHLLIREEKEGGIARYMQRTLNAYTKYFNTKYRKSGHLFQGPYRAVHIESNEQLLHLSAYIHRNPRELLGWKNKEKDYPWSSYQDYIHKNRWDDFLSREIILEQFQSPKEFEYFTETNPAKDGLD